MALLLHCMCVHPYCQHMDALHLRSAVCGVLCGPVYIHNARCLVTSLATYDDQCDWYDDGQILNIITTRYSVLLKNIVWGIWCPTLGGCHFQRCLFRWNHSECCFVSL